MRALADERRSISELRLCDAMFAAGRVPISPGAHCSHGRREGLIMHRRVSRTFSSIFPHEQFYQGIYEHEIEELEPSIGREAAWDGRHGRGLSHRHFLGDT
jgi:hypothetical protein